MTLRRKTLFAAALTGVALIAGLCGVARVVLLGSFVQLEDRQTAQTVTRVTECISNDLDELDSKARDWSYWDDCYAFMADHNQAFVNSNLTPDAIAALRVHVMVFLDLEGNIVESRAVAPGEEKPPELPPEFSTPDIVREIAVTPTLTTGAVRGVLIFDNGPLLTVCEPILTSDRSGPARGVLLLGRYLNELEKHRLERMTRAAIAVHPVPSSEDEPSPCAAGEVVVAHVDEDHARGTTILPGLRGTGYVELAAEVPRDVYQHGRRALAELLVGLTALSVALGALGLILLQRLVVTRVTALGAQVSRIGRTREFGARVALHGRDELSQLAAQVNGLLETIEQSNTDLAEQGRTLATLLSNLPGMVYRCRNDADWTMELVSDGCAELLGYTAADLIDNRRLSYADVIHPDDRAPVWANIQAAVATRSPFQLTYRVHRADGVERWVWEKGRGVFAGDGRLLALEGFITDLTERKRAEERLREQAAALQNANVELEAQQGQLRAQQEELRSINNELRVARQASELANAQLAESNQELDRRWQQLDRQRKDLLALNEQLQAALESADAANRIKSEFLANMSHEIRTPMTAILGYTDLLRDDEAVASSDGRRLGLLDTIHRNGEHLLQLINDILDLSKIEAGKLRIERLWCSPCELVADVAAVVREQADARGLRFDVEYTGPVPARIETDLVRLRQVLINLSGNAIKFTESGGVRLVVAFEPSAAVPEMWFDVIDTGIGMSPADVATLFRPFTQADASMTRRFGGTGLGLTISKRLANLLGGDIELIATAPDQGAHFRVRVAAGDVLQEPLVADPLTAMLVAPPRSAPALRPLPRGCRILLGEDGPDNQRLIKYMLEKAGAVVTVAGDGQQAVDAALAALASGPPFDALLLDMQMPVLDGYAAARTLRSHGFTQPIVALTAHAMVGDREKCLAAGCDEYASKPINRARLIETLARMLQAAPAQSG